MNAPIPDSPRARLLLWLHEHEKTNPGGVPGVGDVLKERGLSLQAAMELVRSMADDGLVMKANAMGSAAASIRDAGRRLAEELLAYRKDLGARRAFARKLVLNVAHQARVAGAPAVKLDGLHATADADFYGLCLEEDEINQAARYLIDNGLLDSGPVLASGEPDYVSLTSLGDECLSDANGDAVRFLRERRAQLPTYQVGTISGSTGIIIGSENNQNVNVGIDPAALRGIIVDLMRELPQFGDAEPAAREALGEIADESAKAQPDANRVGRALARLGDIATQVGANLVVAYVRFKAEEFGILPPSIE